MHKQLPTWQFIQYSLQQQVAVMLLYVLESKGSSPGRQGFMMAVDARGNMQGSLGGGIMEHKFAELAKARLKEEAIERSIHQQVHDKAAAKNQSGMICSGEQTIFLYTVPPDALPTVQQICQALASNQNGSLQLSPLGISFVDAVPDANYALQLDIDANDFRLVEKLGFKNTLHIIGGGHCALALSQLFASLDFFIQLYDDREGLHTIAQNNAVHKKLLLENYAALSGMIEQGSDQYVVVMTVGYRTDMLALEALAGKRFKYIGLLGSVNKTKRLLEEMAARGIDTAWLQNIYTPIGLPIKSQTPEEIAISIAAQIIQVKNAHL